MLRVGAVLLEKIDYVVAELDILCSEFVWRDKVIFKRGRL
jgi:hypothetical protein